MVEKGLAKAGYSYVVMDEGWQALERDVEGRQQHNATRFPSGISALAEHVHKLGLKIGLYRYCPYFDECFSLCLTLLLFPTGGG